MTSENMLKGHRDAAWSLTPLTRNRLVSGSLDGSIRIWDVTDRKCLKTLNNTNNTKVYSTASLPDNEFASGDMNGRISVWNTLDDKPIRTYQHSDLNQPVYSMISLVDETFVTLSGDATIKLWRAGTSDCLHTLETGNSYVSTVVSYPNGYISSESSNFKIGVWNCERGTKVLELSGHQDSAKKSADNVDSRHIRALASLPNDTLATGSNSFDIKVWDLRSRSCTYQLLGHTNYVNTVVYMSDRNFLASTSGDRTIKIWDLRTGTCAETIMTTHTNWIQGLAVLSDNITLVTGSGDHSVGIWRLKESNRRFKEDLDLDPKINLRRESSRDDITKRASSPIPNTIGMVKTDFYYCKSEGNRFVVSMKLDIVNTFRVVLDILDVSQAGLMCNPFISADYKTNVLEIEFRDIEARWCFEKLVQFMSKLKEFGVPELHENTSAMWFYVAGGGDQILNFRNYPKQLEQFLNEERVTFQKVLHSNKGMYDTLVEVGCGELENYELAAANKLAYHGLDFSPSTISAALKKITRKRLKQTTVACLNILDLQEVHPQLKKGSKPVFIFPFNLIGNIAPISLLFSKFRLLQYDLIVSIYKTDAPTNEMRKMYYTNCGYKKLEIRHDQLKGVIFQSTEGLYTVAYSPEYLISLLKVIGFTVTTYQSGQYGIILHAKPRLLQSKNPPEDGVNTAITTKTMNNAQRPPPNKLGQSRNYTYLRYSIWLMCVVLAWIFLYEVSYEKRFFLTLIAILLSYQTFVVSLNNRLPDLNSEKHKHFVLHENGHSRTDSKSNKAPDPNSVTSTFKYTGDQIKDILQTICEYRDDVEILEPIDAYQHEGETLKLNLQDHQFQKILKLSKGQALERIFLLPVNLRNLHWTALYMSFKKTTLARPTVGYFDPMGHPIPNEVVKALVHTYHELQAKDILVSPIELQKDSYNCGPWIIAIFESLLENNTLPPEDFDITEKRRKYDAIISKRRM